MKILVLGAGLVSRPGVHYLLKRDDLFLTIGDIDRQKAKAILNGFDHCRAVKLDIRDTAELASYIRDHHIVVSLLPWQFHPKIARICIEESRHMVTASYVSDEMRSLDSAARDKGIILLNEVGVDPGFDHMTAMDVIHRVHNNGGTVTGFYSFCGGLPAPDSNNNPFSYKFSWNPKGAIMAAENDARFKENNKIIKIKGSELLSHVRLENIDGLGQFEVYPNRDSIPYMSTYGLEHADAVMRGTLRYKGWSRTQQVIQQLGLTDDSIHVDLNQKTYQQILANLTGASDLRNLPASIAGKAGIDVHSPVLDQLKWLGLLSRSKVTNRDNHLDILVDLMAEKLSYIDGERDMLILQHSFITRTAEDKMEKIISTFIDYGIPHGDSSMARTVSLPLAVSVGLIADGKINCRGVQIPIIEEIYQPILKELAQLNIRMKEKTIPIQDVSKPPR